MRVGGQRHAPATFPPRKTRYPLYRRLGGSQGRSGRARKISLTPGFDPRTVQPVAGRCQTMMSLPDEFCTDRHCSRNICAMFSELQKGRYINWKLNFGSPTVHLDIVKMFIYQLMHNRIALKRILKFTLNPLLYVSVQSPSSGSALFELAKVAVVKIIN